MDDQRPRPLCEICPGGITQRPIRRHPRAVQGAVACLAGWVGWPKLGTWPKTELSHLEVLLHSAATTHTAPAFSRDLSCVRLCQTKRYRLLAVYRRKLPEETALCMCYYTANASQFYPRLHSACAVPLRGQRCQWKRGSSVTTSANHVMTYDATWIREVGQLKWDDCHRSDYGSDIRGPGGPPHFATSAPEAANECEWEMSSAHFHCLHSISD